MTPRMLIVDSETRRAYAVKVLSLLPIDKPVSVTVELFKAKRTDTQNKRLWALHTLASEHTGYSPEEMHEHALCRHFGYTEKEVTDLFTGEIVQKRIPNKRSSVRNTKEFAEFMTRTEEWYIADFGCFLE